MCDFEGVFVSMDPTPTLEGTSTLFCRVAELHEEHRTRFPEAAETGKVVASALPSRLQNRGCCSDPSVASSASMNPVVPRPVGSLSNRRLLSFSFEEERGWSRCVMVCWQLNHRGFGFSQANCTG